LYRKLAANPWANTVNRKLCKDGEVVEEALYKCITEGWIDACRLTPHGITGTLDQTKELRIKCPLTRPITWPNFVAIRQEVCKISVVEKF